MYSIFFNLILVFTANSLHDFHVSKCEIEYNSSKQRVEVCQFIFLDDLEFALENQGYEKQHLCTELEKPSADSILSLYLNDRINLSLRDSTIKLTMFGKEISDDLSAVNIYMYSNEIKPNTDLTLENKVLLELYDDQNNMVYWTSGSGKKSYFVVNNNQKEIELPNE